MSGYDDMVGLPYGRWVVTGRDFSRKLGRGYPYLLCLCRCGTSRSVHVTSLVDGTSTSCGCARRDSLVARKTTHGHAGAMTRAYRCWVNMKTRCYNPKSTDYEHYGGRGIAVCARWRDSFPCFLADMGPPPPGLSLDRRDVNGDYSPNNCRWATSTQQARNRRAYRAYPLEML